MELQERALGTKPLHAIWLPPFLVRIEPAVPQHEAQDVRSRPQLRGQIIGVVEHPFAVIAFGRGQHAVADPLAVAREFVIAQARHVNQRPADGFVSDEAFAEQSRTSVHRHFLGQVGKLLGAFEKTLRRTWFLRRTAANPLRLPVFGSEQCHLPRCRRTPMRGVSGSIPHPHFPVTTEARGQRRAIIRHVRGLGRLDLTRIPQVAFVRFQQRRRGGHQNVISALLLIPLARFQPPAQLRLDDIHTQGVLGVFTAEVGGLHPAGR